MSVLRCVMLAALLLVVPHAAGFAAEDRASISVLVENDSFGTTDRHYTNGLKLSWLSRKRDFARLSAWLADHVPLFPTTGGRRIGFALGQNIYTPDDLAATTLLTDDRPYAGWSYVELGMTSETDSGLDSLAISLGVVGPASQADEVHEFWHRAFGFTRPRGWRHQLDDEPTLNIAYQHSRRFYWENALPGGLDGDVMPHFGLSLGNVFTYGAAGLTLRFGEDFKGDFAGPPRIRPSMPGASHFQAPEGYFGWYVFAGIEGRAVARNIFLDGNTFSDSHSVDKKTLVGDAQIGFALIFKRFRLTYTQVISSNEFDGQDQPHNFGALSLTANF